MAGAYYEKIARINLTTGEIKIEKLDLAMAQKFIGGRGLGTKILYDEGVATVDPLSEDNKLIYITGPMTGTRALSSGRYMVVTKSTLTGMIGCSNSGGVWGAKLKCAGWDAWCGNQSRILRDRSRSPPPSYGQWWGYPRMPRW